MQVCVFGGVFVTHWTVSFCALANRNGRIWLRLAGDEQSTACLRTKYVRTPIARRYALKISSALSARNTRPSVYVADRWANVFMSSLGDAIRAVLFWRSGNQMRRLNARRIVARMRNEQSRRD